MKQTKLFALKVALPLVLTASLSQAAVVFDTGASASAAPASGLTWNHTVTAASNTILMVAFSYEDAATSPGAAPASITYGSQSLTPLLSTNAVGGTNENYLAIWYLVNPAVGTNAITFASFSIDSLTNVVKGSSASFFGVTSAPSLFQTDANTDGTAPSVSFTGVTSGSALYSAAVFSASGSAAGTTDVSLTFPTGGTLNGGQSAQHTGYNLSVGGDFISSFSTANGQTAMGAVILPSAIPEPSSMLLGAFGVLGLLRRRRA